jgi:steroid 5-alpha reductase family enzyme
MWILIAIIIESMALVGVLSILITKRTLAAFLAGFNTMALVTFIYVCYSGVYPRTLLVIAMVAFYLVRMNWVLLLWSGQTALDKLDNRTSIAQRLVLPVVLSNTVGWAYCLPFYFATRNTEPLGPGDILAIGLYLFGTVFHFGGDYQKRRFKLREEGKDELLNTGFWAICRHPNYFGDFLIYVSFAVLGSSIWAWIAPLLNLLQYAFDAIPKSEKWSEERYGSQWERYKAKTKKFIPYLV